MHIDTSLARMQIVMHEAEPELQSEINFIDENEMFEISLCPIPRVELDIALPV